MLVRELTGVSISDSGAKRLLQVGKAWDTESYTTHEINVLPSGFEIAENEAKSSVHR